jgi:hypothetical protein
MTRKPSFDVAKARELRASGLGPSEIARMLGVGRNSVYRVLESSVVAKHITKAEREQGVIYALPGRRRPDGWRLAHNHVRHGARTRDGVRGFRIFWIDPALIAADASKWAACDCGWRPELGVHYARR